MKRLFVFIVAALCTMPVVAKEKGKQLKFAKNQVVAHRGAFKANGFPENSIAALKEAIRLRCAGSEFDVRMTADDSLIVNHDQDFQSLVIEKSNYSDLIQYSLTNNEQLPTLRNYLLAGMDGNKRTRLVLEIKPTDMGEEHANKIVDAVVKMVKNLKAEPYIVYISFDYNMLLHLKKLVPNAPMQYLGGDKSPEMVHADGIAGLDYKLSAFEKNPEWIDSAKKLGIMLNAWTVNDAANMDKLLQLGFDFITTNQPELLLKRIKARK